MKRPTLWFLTGAVALCVFATLLLKRMTPAASEKASPVKNDAVQEKSSIAVQLPATQVRPATVRTENFEKKLPNFADEIQQVLSMKDSEERERLLTSLLQKWVANDAIAAANFAQTIESPVLREDITRRVVEMWADKDSSAALSWAAQLSDSSEREVVMGFVCVQVSESDPQKAVQLVFANNLEGDSGLLDTVTAHWAVADYTAARDWAEAQPAGEQRDDLMSQITYVRSQTDPADAARLAVEQIPPGDAQNEAAISVVHQWALQDWNGASAWVQSFPEGPIRERAMNELSAIASHQNTDSISGN